MPSSVRVVTRRLTVLVVLLVIGPSTAVRAQEACSSTEDPRGEEWESIVSRRLALDSIRREAIERTAGGQEIRPAGMVGAYADTATGETRIVVESRGLPEAAEEALVRRVVEHLEARPLEADETLVLDLRRGVETELPRGDGAIERCRPILANREDVSSALEEAARDVLDFMEDAGDEARDVRREILLDVLLDRTGQLEKVMVATPSGNPYLNVRAREVGRQMRFDPATLNGVPVAAWVRVPVNFNLPSSD